MSYRQFTVFILTFSVFVCVVILERSLSLSVVKGDGAEACKSNVDIVITIHDALSDLKGTIQSLEASELRLTSFSTCPPHVFLVDANSSSSTVDYLKSKSLAGSSGLRYSYIRRSSSSYTKAVNRGIIAGTAETIVVLNSDVIVPYRWLSKLRRALYSSPRIGMVGPLSNSACYQSVPVLSPHHWAQNALPEGITVETMNSLLESNSFSKYPVVPLLNGFLFAVRRDVVKAVGVFDEIKFPHGYGEENDFCLRVRKAGYSLLVADQLYVYHSKSVSFGKLRRTELIRDASLSYGDEVRRYIKFSHDELSTLPSLIQKRRQVSLALESSR